MTPAEQAKYLMVQGQWREQMMEKRHQKAAEKK